MITAGVLDGIPAVRHAFFTRRGGVSEGPYASLNCGTGCGDDPHRVAVNRGRAMERLGLSGDALATARQVHSAAAAVVEAPPAQGSAPRVDGLVTRVPGIALGVLTADCAPVLFADAGAGVVGAAHAGWRGALAGILEAVIEAMEGVGADRAGTVAAIGPCIHQPSYEVGPEFRAEFLEDDAGSARFFVASGRPEHHLFDLPGYLEGRLAGLGLKAVQRLPVDTRAEVERFFSHRRAVLGGEKDCGRGLSAIALGD